MTAPKPTPKRGKTTGASNAGSYAPKGQSAPGARASLAGPGGGTSAGSPSADRTSGPAMLPETGLKSPSGMTRAELLEDSDLRFAPSAWTAEKSDFELSSLLAEIRAARMREIEGKPTAAPDWLTRDVNHRGYVSYRSADGYSVSETIAYVEGRAVREYRVHGRTASGDQGQAALGSLPEVVSWIEEQRQERAPSWTEAFPINSAAANVAEFRGRPVEQWTGKSGDLVFIAADGSYVSVVGDGSDDWVCAEGEFADGTFFDAGGSYGDAETAKREGLRVLRAGKAAYETDSGWD